MITIRSCTTGFAGLGVANPNARMELAAAHAESSIQSAPIMTASLGSGATIKLVRWMRLKHNWFTGRMPARHFRNALNGDNAGEREPIPYAVVESRYAIQEGC
jgi:hypothetical protein